MLLFFLINFDINIPHDGLRYPHPPLLDIAILDKSFHLKEQEQLSFSNLEDTADETLLMSWSDVLKVAVSIISQADERILIFPSKGHFDLFHIIKQKSGLSTKAKSNAYFCRRKVDSRSDCMMIEEMISAVQIMGVNQEANLQHPDYYLVWSKSKKSKSQAERILERTSYCYIGDTRTELFHDLKSACLKGVPGEFMRGLGKDPRKAGFSPCPQCLGRFTSPVQTKTPTVKMPKIKPHSGKSKSDIMRSQIKFLSEQYGMHAEFHGNMVYVTTVAGEWYFDYNDRPIRLRHKNAEKRVDRHGKLIGHYHRQQYEFHAPLQVLAYIRNHEQAEVHRLMDVDTSGIGGQYSDET